MIKLQRSTSRARLAMISGSAWSLFPTRIFSRGQHANDFRRPVNDPTYQATFPAMRLVRDTDREITTTKRGKRIATSIDASSAAI